MAGTTVARSCPAKAGMAMDQSLRHCEEQSDEAIQISAHELDRFRYRSQ